MCPMGQRMIWLVIWWNKTWEWKTAYPHSVISQKGMFVQYRMKRDCIDRFPCSLKTGPELTTQLY